MAVELTPEVGFPIVTVTMVYPGAGPEEIETLVVEPIEEEVSTISGVKHVQAVAREGIAILIVEFEIGTQVDMTALDVKDKIDAIRAELPDDAEDPIISKFDINALPVLELAISSPRPLEELYRIADKVIKDRLSRVSGVASVEIVGGKEREILIAVHRYRWSIFQAVWINRNLCNPLFPGSFFHPHSHACFQAFKKRRDRRRRKKWRILNRFWRWWDRFYDELALSYKGSLHWALQHRVIVFVGITVLFFTSLFLMRFVGTEFFTPSDEGQIPISLEMPAGTRIKQTDLALQRVEEIVQQIPEVESIYTVLGKIEAGGLAASTNFT